MTATMSKIVYNEIFDVTVFEGTGSRNVIIVVVAFKDGDELVLYFQEPRLARDFANRINQSVENFIE